MAQGQTKEELTAPFALNMSAVGGFASCIVSFGSLLVTDGGKRADYVTHRQPLFGFKELESSGRLGEAMMMLLLAMLMEGSKWSCRNNNIRRAA